ncbi:MAG: V4R domain-containing protein [Nitrososphaerales archaeon]
MSEENSLELPLILLRPGHRIINLGMKLKKISDALSVVLKIIASMNLKVLSIITGNVTDESQPSTVSIFLDGTEVKDEMLESLKEFLKNDPFVMYVEVNETGIEGFGAEMFHQRLILLGQRAMVLTHHAIVGLIRGLYERFGEEAFALLFMQGIGVGKEAIKRYRELFGKKELILRAHEILLSVMGYTKRAKFTMISEEKFTLLLDGLIECETLKGLKMRKTCHWYRGIITGFFSELMQKEYKAEEVSCINNGDKECILLLQPK